MTQQEAIEIMLSGQNVFLTGAPGAGKTYTLNEFIQAAGEKMLKVAVTASTGIAASHIGGTTIHSWSGLGILDSIDQEALRKIKTNSRVVKRYKNTDILVIDEISMLHGAKLDMVNIVAQAIRGNHLPFGGIQVILVGDLFQLPPVSRNTDVFDFAHKSTAWGSLSPRICYITEQHRQNPDDPLLQLLDAMRSGEVGQNHRDLLKTRILAADEDTVTRLYSHNMDVDSINSKHLAAIVKPAKKYSMIVDGNKIMYEAMVRNILAPQQLELKVGAEVMFVANNFNVGFFNGTRGRVVKFSKDPFPLPIVKLTNGRTIKVDIHTWAIKEEDRVLASVEQIPLRLAWAITIHKSQGMSLDAAQVDLSRAFTPGMGYVALSRVRSLEGLYLQGINEMAFRMHGEIYDFDAELRRASEEVL